MLHSSDIKYVDLKHSEWDRKKSNPRKSEYVFTGRKLYINYFDRVRRPEWFLSMARWNPDSRPPFRELIHWKHSYGYQEVNVDTDCSGDKAWVWPEPLVPDENGHYIYGDLIIVKRRLLDELQDRVDSGEASRNAARTEEAAWNAQMDRQGIGISKDIIRKEFERERDRG